MKSRFFLAVLGISVALLAPLNSVAQIENRDPNNGYGSGGGGEYTCISGCKKCTTSCTENNNCYSYCTDAMDGSCGCVFSGDHAEVCGGTGVCTYW